MEREQTTIRLPVELKERLEREAERKGLTINQFDNYVGFIAPTRKTYIKAVTLLNVEAFSL